MPGKFLDILPDPNTNVTDGGFEASSADPGTAGQGFASVKLSRENKQNMSTTIGGRSILSAQMAPKWLIEINYNPMTKAQFDPVYNFLLEKQNSRRAFYVILPQYKLPKDSAFATYAQGNTINTTETGAVGATSLEIDEPTLSSLPLPSFGDLFNLADPNDTLHNKAYMVSRVETATDYLIGNAPAGGSIRIHFTPGLQKPTTSGSEVVFVSPTIRVTQVGDVREHQLNKENLYLFSIKLEETIY